MQKHSKIYIAGHRGLVGSAIKRRLEQSGYSNLIYRTSQELDLKNQLMTTEFFNAEKPEYVILAAAKVGGIQANYSYPAEFIYDNLIIQANVIHAAYLNRVKKLLFLGSSCIYPKLAPQPMREEYLLTSELESTNEAYAISKIAGIKMCEAYNRQYGTNFMAVMPTNLYGPNDNFDLENSHVLPAMIRKFHEAKVSGKPTVEIWGSGKPRREFLFVDDLAEACVLLMEKFDYHEIGNFINIGTGVDITIKELAELIQRIVDYKGKLIYNTEMPDGTLQKLLDVTKLQTMGWLAKTSLEDGIKRTYDWYTLNCNRCSK
jgi:GDP-L-fucose synthase